MLAASGLMAWTSRAARQLRPTATKIGLWIMLAVALGVTAARFADFRGTHVRWSTDLPTTG